MLFSSPMLYSDLYTGLIKLACGAWPRDLAESCPFTSDLWMPLTIWTALYKQHRMVLLSHLCRREWKCYREICIKAKSLAYLFTVVTAMDGKTGVCSSSSRNHSSPSCFRLGKKGVLHNDWGILTKVCYWHFHDDPKESYQVVENGNPLSSLISSDFEQDSLQIVARSQTWSFCLQ